MAPYFRFNIPCASTTTTTTTIPQYTVTIYGKLNLAGQGSPIKFQYSTDNGTNWTDAGDFFDSTTCDIRGSFSVSSGTTADVRAVDASLNRYSNSRTLNSTTCPGSPYNSCVILVSSITSNRNIAVTVDVFTYC